MKKSLTAILVSLLAVNLAVGATVLSIPSITIDSRGTTTDATGIKDQANVPLRGNGTATGCIVQIIDAGSDAKVNVPRMIDLGLTGDDSILATVNIGFGFPTSADSGLFSKTVAIDPGKTIFVRAWNDSLSGASTYYGESITYNVGISGVQTFFAGLFTTSKNRDMSAPSAVITLNALATVRAVNLGWTNSVSTDNLGTLVVRSTSPITWTPENNRDYLDSLDFADYTALLVTPGIRLVYTGANTSALDTGLSANVTYYYAAFAYDTVYNYATAVAGSAIPTSGISLTAEIPFTFFQAVAGDAKNDLSWGVSSNAVGYTRVEIWRIQANTESTSNYPASPTSPAVLVTSGSFTAGTYTDANLTNYRYYYYAIFAQQASGTYSQPATTFGRPQTGSSYKAYNYPNPFSPKTGQTTTIVFPLAGIANYDLKLFSMTGDLVWTNSGSGVAGANTVVWNGNNAYGNVVPNGVYLLRVLSGGKVVASGKVSVLD
ncbi:MAG: T9SS type A sorting domain-containing protein [Candidatus Margulisiibacteriota bacterium]